VAVVVLDNFTTADGTNLAGRTPSPTNTPGGTWTEQTGDWSITGNEALIAVSTDRAAATIEGGAADVTLTCECKSVGATNSNRDAGLVARWSDASNFWSIGPNQGLAVFRIVERNAAVNTVRATTSITTDTTNYKTIQAVLSGQTIDGTYEGGNAIQYTSAALNETATVHGMRVRDAAGDRIDDFQVESAAAGVVGPLLGGRLVKRGILQGRLKR
jgi:hypothetical protein